jgi:Lrp/AsnC family transcriptional regulator for asnA, asnC and gidA
MPLDRLDLAILHRLLRDGRASFTEIARELKMPDTTIHFRVKRLKELGALKKFTAAVDPHALGLVDIALVKLKIETLIMPHLIRDRLEDLAEEFQSIEEVKFVAISVDAGELILIIATNDRQRTNAIVEQMQKSGGVERADAVRITNISKGQFLL